MVKTTFTPEDEAAIHALIAQKEGPVSPLEQLADNAIEWSINSVEHFYGDTEIRLTLLANQFERTRRAKDRTVQMQYVWCVATK